MLSTADTKSDNVCISPRCHLLLIAKVNYLWSIMLIKTDKNNDIKIGKNRKIQLTFNFQCVTRMLLRRYPMMK